jgi:hypothetical protein
VTVYAFIQPYGFAQPGGGARILRAMTEVAPASVVSINTAPEKQPPPRHVTEAHVPYRPWFGRLERTRYARNLGHLARFLERSFRGRVCRALREQSVGAVHAVAHGPDLWAVFEATRMLGLPFYLSVHDDPIYMLAGMPQVVEAPARLGIVWRDAEARTVISEELGRECCRRWGDRPYVIVTDGLVEIRSASRPRIPERLCVYFGGLMLLGYTPNFRALYDALCSLRVQRRDLDVSLHCRGGEPAVIPRDVTTVWKPWGSESAMQADLDAADVLYMPLPFAGDDALTRYSLSTKMVTYLAAGVPILYHGPRDAAAARLLERHDAAVICSSLDREAIVAAIHTALDRRDDLVRNALVLASRSFRLEDIRARFWSALGASTPLPAATVGAASTA